MRIIPIYMEMTSGGHNKFWEIGWTTDKSWTTAYGRIGSSGSETTRTYTDHWHAQQEMAKLIREKMSKGYKGKTRPVDRQNVKVEGFKDNLCVIVNLRGTVADVLAEDGTLKTFPVDNLQEVPQDAEEVK